MSSLGKIGDKLATPSHDEHRRRSMELEERPLPEGWVRQYDPASEHHFYVDTRANPPRSIWNHPLDDEEYIHSHGRHPSDSESSDEDDAPPPSYKEKGEAGKSRPPDLRAVPSSGQPSGSSSQSRGLFGSIMNALSGPSHEDPALQQRYTDRRVILNQNQGRVPANVAGPMYYGTGYGTYAPPPVAFMGRPSYHDQRRAYRDLRREEKRNARAVRRAVRRGYAVPPEFLAQGPAPLFGYRAW